MLALHHRVATPAQASPGRRRTVALLLGFVLVVGSAIPLCGVANTVSAASSGPLHQLRVYEIFEHNKAAFHARFRDHALRIMQRYDFDIVAIWEARTAERTEFIYLLRWPDEATMKDRWARFLADEEWRTIKRETGAKHGTLVGDIQEKVLHSTDYSPALAP